MIVRLSGTVIEVGKESTVLERDGIAREVLVPGYAVGELCACRGMEVTLHTLEFIESNPSGGHLVPRVVGFLHAEDKKFFNRFVSVKGIGVRKALKALAEPVRTIATWIEQEDKKSLRRLPGIGGRAADMIVAELKGKLDGLATGEPRAPLVDSERFSADQRDALEVLIALGETRMDAERWLERAAQLNADLAEPEAWVRAAYRIKTGVEG